MKYAVVTGGTSGMGLGVAKMLLSKVYYVFTTYVGSDFTEKIENFEALKIDQTNRAEVYKFIDYVKAGMPLIAIATVVSMIILPIAFPFYP